MADKHLVFVTAFATGDDGAIHAFSLDTGSGALEPLHRTGDIDNAFFIALSPDRKYLYATVTSGDFDGAQGHAAAFEIIGDNGELKELNRQPSKGLTTCYVQVDPTGKAVVIANYTSGDVGSYPVQADGSLGEMQSFFQHEGASLVNAARQEKAHAHCAEISPDGNYMYACDLGHDLYPSACYYLDRPVKRLNDIADLPVGAKNVYVLGRHRMPESPFYELDKFSDATEYKKMKLFLWRGVRRLL